MDRPGALSLPRAVFFGPVAPRELMENRIIA